jgi:very-short-patch-repair endonuclease
VTQIAMHGYIVDFFFPQFNTAIELDGPHHDRKRDAQRDATLLKNGVQVLRFKNPEDKVGLNQIFCRIYSEIRFQSRRTKGGRKCQF